MEAACSHLLNFLLFSSLLLSYKSFAAIRVADTFGKGQNLTDGETLVSAGGTFTMGFFSPGASTKRYLGIWFTVSPDAICWVANRDRPLTGNSGVLMVSDTGSLLLLDGGSGQVAWSSNSTSASSSAEAQLLNSGNLVVRDHGSTTISWQSYGYTAKPGAPLTRVVVMDTGVVKRLVWDASARAWVTFFQGPRDVCDAYGKCGAFGLCDAGAASTSFCSCLRGFSPASPAAWDMREASAGCRRNVALDCGDGTTDGFMLVQGVQLPDTHNASVDMGITVEECRVRCRANCSCVAYAAADIRRGGAAGSGCIMWTDDIIDLRYVDRGQDLYLRLAKSELDDFRSLKFPFVALIGSVASIVAIVLLFIMIWWTRKNKVADIIPQDPAMAVPFVDLSTIKEATGDFAKSQEIAEGGFAIVYKGELPDRRTVAIKRFKPSALTTKGKSDFTREVEVMARLRHGNLLRLLAYCNEGEERILIYAYMSNKSLDCYIFGEARLRVALNWRQRLDIVHGVAQGVAYLHEGSGETVVHRDLKPPNILLDDNWRPKIADFNTAKLFVADRPESKLTIVYTPGYASPEYALQGEMTLKCDVYSFGVIVLETLSGQKNYTTQGFLSHAWALWEQDRAVALLDPTVAVPLPGLDSEIISELERCVQIGLLCVQEAPDDRPAMSAVVAMLTSKSSHIDRPSKPVLRGRTTDLT